MASLRIWFKATQPHSFPASLVGVALGTAIAWSRTGRFDAAALALTALGVVCLHAGTNMSNDSIDFKRGVDNLPPRLVSPFTGGARVLPEAAVSFEAHRRVWMGFFAAVAVIFGPLVVLGSYVVQTGAVSAEPVWVSIPLGLLVAAFLLVNEMPEHETDPRGGKRTIPARIGLERSVRLYEAMVFAALLLLVVFAVARLVPWPSLLGLIAIVPLSTARSVLRAHFREYPAHIRANAATIQAVLLLGAGMTAGYIVAGVPNL